MRILSPTIFRLAGRFFVADAPSSSGGNGCVPSLIPDNAIINRLASSSSANTPIERPATRTNGCISDDAAEAGELKLASRLKAERDGELLILPSVNALLVNTPLCCSAAIAITITITITANDMRLGLPAVVNLACRLTCLLVAYYVRAGERAGSNEAQVACKCNRCRLLCA